GQASVDFDRRALSREAVHDSEDAQTAARSHRVADKIERPFLIGPCEVCVHRRYAYHALALQTPHHQPFLSVQPVHAFHVHRPALSGQHRPQTPVAIARLLSRQVEQRLPQLGVAVRSGVVTVTGAVHFQKPASLPLADAIFRHRERHVPPRAHKLHPFFRITPFSTSRSRLRSATISFRRRFSSSSARNRLASETSMPPYFDFQL